MRLHPGEGVFLLLLLIAAVVQILTRWLRLPYIVGLVAAGMALALLPAAPDISFTKDLTFNALLPPLIFEAAFALRWDQLRRDLPVIVTLASAGVAIAGAVAMVGLHYLAQWTWLSAAIFGALIAATDPVSIIATFREAKVQGRLRLLVESESLFNDGTAAVAFVAAVAVAGGGKVTALSVTRDLVFTTGGALLCGALVAAVALVLIGRTEDHLVELTFTTVAAYGSFLLAEELHLSGVFATIAAGLTIGNAGHLGVLTSRGRDAVQAFWEYAAFVANSLIFLLVGMHEVRQNFTPVWWPIVVAIAFVLLGRAAAVYPLCLLFWRSRLRVSWPHQNILFWGGLRGALALALAFSLPDNLPGRSEIITVSFAVIAFSVFVQALSMSWLLRASGELPSPTTEPEAARVH